TGIWIKTTERSTALINIKIDDVTRGNLVPDLSIHFPVNGDINIPIPDINSINNPVDFAL
ncbi:hypothetical protein BM530_22615, partial [Clostridioides difficile]